jgi:hypothetical protein
MSCFSQGAEFEVVYPPDVILPKFNDGGLDKFYEYVNKNFDFSKVTKPGKMITSFTVDEQGEIKNIRVNQFVDIESATEIIRLLKNAPKWQPAIRGGKPFSVAIKFPLDFQFSKKNEEQKTTQFDKPLNEAQSDSVTTNTSGGLKKFYDFIKKNYRIPNVQNIKGQVAVSFTINEDGTLSDFKIVKDLKHGTGEELIRVLKLTSGKWTPAMKEGKKVKSTFTLPLNIHTPDE